MGIGKLSDDARELLSWVLGDEDASRQLYHCEDYTDVSGVIDRSYREFRRETGVGISNRDIDDVARFLAAHLEELNDNSFDASGWMTESALTERNQVNATKRRRYQTAMGDHVLGADSGGDIHSGSGRAKQKFRRAAKSVVHDPNHDGASDAKRNLSRAWLNSKKGTQMQRGNGSFVKMDKKARGVREEVKLGEGVVRSVKRFIDKIGGPNSRQAKRISKKALDRTTHHLKALGPRVDANPKHYDLDNDRDWQAAQRNTRRAQKARKNWGMKESAEQLTEKSLWKKIKRAVQAHTDGTAAHEIHRAKKTRASIGEKKPERVKRVTYRDAKFLSTDKWGNYHGGKYKSMNSGRSRPKLPVIQGRM